MQSNDILKDIIYFFVLVLSNSITGLITFFGDILVFGLLLYILSNFTRKVYARTLGAKAEIFITGFIGTPVHELSHALFCLIFNHKISDIKIFSPNSNNATLGYVTHSYDQRSWYQQAGNFFIGIAPIVMGALIIYLLIRIMLPNVEYKIFNIVNDNNIFMLKNTSTVKDIIVGSFSAMIKLFTSTFYNIKNIFLAVVTNENIKTIRFWIFIFITISIASHMELSPADIKHALKGIMFIFALFLIINSVLSFIVLISDKNIFEKIGEYSINLLNLFLLKSRIILLIAFLFSLLNFVITYILLTPVSIIKYKKLINIR